MQKQEMRTPCPPLPSLPHSLQLGSLTELEDRLAALVTSLYLIPTASGLLVATPGFFCECWEFEFRSSCMVDSLAHWANPTPPSLFLSSPFFLCTYVKTNVTCVFSSLCAPLSFFSLNYFSCQLLCEFTSPPGETCTTQHQSSSLATALLTKFSWLLSC